jgi:hypothetical protein
MLPQGAAFAKLRGEAINSPAGNPGLDCGEIERRWDQNSDLRKKEAQVEGSC